MGRQDRWWGMSMSVSMLGRLTAPFADRLRAAATEEQTAVPIVERLREPSYRMSGSDQGDEGENLALLEAADTIETLSEALDEALRVIGWPAVGVAQIDGGHIYTIKLGLCGADLKKWHGALASARGDA